MKRTSISATQKKESNVVLHLHEHGDTDPKKKLRWLINNPQEDAIKMNITPELADEMLGYNTGNRPLSVSCAAGYARQMTNGDWRTTRMPIVFSANGKLQDGQHRLQACVDSGVALTAWVAFGDPDENFAFIDIGKKRGASDIFHINGVPNYLLMSAAARWVWSYDVGGFNTSRNTGHAGTITPAELYEFFTRHEALPESAKFGVAFNKHRLGPPGPMIGAHYVCGRKSRRQADQFFRKVSDGLGFEGKRDPAYKVHQLLQEYSRDPMRTQQVFLTAAVIKAWNAGRTGNSPKSFEWRKSDPTERFPRAI